jgi:acyl-CoA thioesterase I
VKRFILFICVFVLSWAHSSLAAPVKVACIGDSITEGSNVGSQETYPARLQRLLGPTNTFLVQNFGVSGRTLLKRGDFPYWREQAFTNSRTFGPNIVIIQLGTNDGKPYNWIYGTNFISDYKEMIAIYAALPSAPRIFVCTPCPVFGSGNFDINPGTVRTNIAPRVRQIAEELTLPLIDLQLRMTNSVWFPDTVHPDATGMTVMAAVMFEAITGGLPNQEAPSIKIERPLPGRIILSWPAQWGALVPRMANVVTTNVNSWSILQTYIPWSDGTTIRQTNLLPNTSQRFFRLARP